MSSYVKVEEYHDDHDKVEEYHDDPNHVVYRDDTVPLTRAELTDEIKSNIFDINTRANAIELWMKSIGTEKDNRQLRDRIHETSQITSTVVERTRCHLHSLADKRANKQQKVQFEILKSQFHDAIYRVHTLQTKMAKKVKSAVYLLKHCLPAPMMSFQMPPGEKDAGESSRDKLSGQALKEQAQLVGDEVFLIQEREQRILQVESDILDVNTIFMDLGALVLAQGDILDTLDGSVDSATAKAESANQERIKAAEFQHKSRRKMCCFTIMFVILAAAVGVIIWLSFQSEGNSILPW